MNNKTKFPELCLLVHMHVKIVILYNFLCTEFAILFLCAYYIYGFTMDVISSKTFFCMSVHIPKYVFRIGFYVFIKDVVSTAYFSCL